MFSINEWRLKLKGRRTRSLNSNFNNTLTQATIHFYFRYLFSLYTLSSCNGTLMFNPSHTHVIGRLLKYLILPYLIMHVWRRLQCMILHFHIWNWSKIISDLNRFLSNFIHVHVKNYPRLYLILLWSSHILLIKLPQTLQKVSMILHCLVRKCSIWCQIIRPDHMSCHDLT